MKNKALACWHFARAIAPDIIGLAAVTAILFVVFFFSLGCASGTKQIARAASNTDTLTATIDDHTRALRPIVGDSPEGIQHIDGIEQATRDIRVETRKVHEALPKVKDIQPWWAQMLENTTWILLGAGVLFALFYFGLAAPIRAFFVFVGSHFAAILPAKAKGQAKLDAEALETNPTPELDKSIAVRRASDPMYDAAWKAQKRKTKAVNP
mgnify:FL=1